MHNEKSDDTRKRNKDDPFKSLEEMIKTRAKISGDANLGLILLEKAPLQDLEKAGLSR